MTAASAAGIRFASPQDVWQALAEDSAALLVDVRTRAEWAFVGAPDLSGAAAEVMFAEWTQFPAMSPNPRFIAEVAAEIAAREATTVYFICRSGARSASAASAMQAHLAAEGRDVACVNVAEGFEGDLDGQGRRGAVNGWKARGLPWRQT